MLDQRDAQLKKERGYHGKSFVRPDGSECLLDKRDWMKRKQELYERSEGRCEFVANCASLPKGKNRPWLRWEGRCTNMGQVPAHYPVPRHPRRDDRLTNLKNFCFLHDRLTEPQGWRKPRFGEGSKPIQKRLGGKA